MDQRDIEYLNKALRLAENGRGLTSPNPIVGALIVRDGETLGQGWHAGAGLDHAEVAAIRDAVGRGGDGPGADEALQWERVRAVCSGATMYVTLEPCCTQGRTPPCTTALINSGFARVIVAAVDPSPGVNGKGLELLRESGIEVEVAEGSVNHRAKRQNDASRKSVVRGLPFVTYKFAMTLDGRVATDSGDSRWISGEESRALVHQWRAWSDAVVVGGGTLEADDPALTARAVECVRQPLRVVVDSRCSLHKDARLARSAAEGPILLVCGKGVSHERLEEVQGWGVSTEAVEQDEDGALDPLAVCEALAARGVQSVLLEGGPRLAGSWWSAGVIDKVAAFVSPKVGSGSKMSSPLCGPGADVMGEAAALLEVEVARVGEDVLVTGYTGGPF